MAEKPICKPVRNEKGEIYKYEYVCFDGKIYTQHNQNDDPLEMPPERLAQQLNTYSDMLTEKISEITKTRWDILKAIGLNPERVFDLLVQHGWDDETDLKDADKDQL